MLVNGKWQKAWDPYQKTSDKGEFVRQNSSIRHRVSDDENADFPVEPNRYHLYVAYICPWASRTLMARAILGLEDVISVSVVDPRLSDQGWRFGAKESTLDGSTEDSVNHFDYTHQLYTHSQADFTGRATIPILWDKQNNTMVNNESSDILEMLNGPFSALGDNQINLRPQGLIGAIDEMNKSLYDTINNGVYKAGFALSQEAYAEATQALFHGLDRLEAHLHKRHFLVGETLTESDLRLFVTLIRFDAVYYSLFKCNLKRISDYKNLHRYMYRILQIPGVAHTVNMEHIKQGYYSVKALNPNGIVPIGPKIHLLHK